MTPTNFHTDLESLAARAAEEFGVDDPRVRILTLAGEYTPVDPDLPEYEQRHQARKFQTRAQNVLANL